MVPPLSDHTLFKDEFIQNHIIQHYARHYEIMQIILHQMALHNNHPDFLPETVLTAETISRQVEQIPQGKYKIGGDPAFAYDNERPEHVVELDTYNISMHPVSNAEYLAFIEDRGYQTSEYWSADGWQWLSENNIHHPEHWRQNRNGDWYGINQQGPFTLANNDCVYGINFYEASAFAHWANARLPHEYEWETCAKLERIQNSGKVWEWCSNLFQAYDQFQAFPDNTTEASFDDKHYVLKGASQYTRPEIRRASYRNYQTPEKRYIFAGLRLVFD